MSTDNGNLLSEEKAERSLFGLSETLRTSQPLGQIGVVDSIFAMPKDTIKHRSGVHFELKPTTDKISTKIRSHYMSAAVPLRNIWHYYDEFISKGSSIIKTGGLNVPYIQRKEDESINSLPYTELGRLCRAFLTYLPFNSSDYSAKWRWPYGYVGSITYPFSVTDFDSINTLPLGSFSAVSSLLARVSTSFKITYDDDKVWFHLEDAQSIALARVLFPYLRTKPNLKRIVIGSIFHPVQWNGSSQGTYFDIFGSDTVYDASSKSNIPSPVYGYSAGKEKPMIGFSLGSLSTSVRDFDYFYFSESSVAATTSGYYRIYDGDYLTCCSNLVSYIFSTLFAKSDLFGDSSLMAQLGVHLLKSYDVSQDAPLYATYETREDTSTPSPQEEKHKYWSDYVGRDVRLTTSGVEDTYFSMLDVEVLQAIVTNASSSNGTYYQKKSKYRIDISTLPFYAYQKIVSDRFLLPHEVLSNNSGNNSNVTNNKFDSPYFQNLCVPTKCYTHDGRDELDTCLIPVFSSSGASSLQRIDRLPLDPQDYHYSILATNFILLFLSRNCMMDVDVFTKNWQKRDHNIQNIVNASAYNIVNPSASSSGEPTTGTIDIKKFLMSHALSKTIRFGGADQSAKSVIERMYGVNDIPSYECNSILLHKNVHELKTEDVMNSGGTVNPSGESMALGEKVSICSDDVPASFDFECFCPDFTIILNLHYFDTETYRERVPNFCSYHLGQQRYRLRDMFEVAFFPQYQSLGDEPMHLDSIEFGEKYDDATLIGWTNKNQLLKDADINRISGEFCTKYRRQIVGNNTGKSANKFAPSLTYAYLQPPTSAYYLPLVDKFGDAVLCTWYNDTFKKSCMTKSNIIGL